MWILTGISIYTGARTRSAVPALTRVTIPTQVQNPFPSPKPKPFPTLLWKTEKRSGKYLYKKKRNAHRIRGGNAIEQTQMRTYDSPISRSGNVVSAHAAPVLNVALAANCTPTCSQNLPDSAFVLANAAGALGIHAQQAGGL